jgi:hypothetical protein
VPQRGPEAASSDRTYFRTSLNDYQKMHARARYQVVAVAERVGQFQPVKQSESGNGRSVRLPGASELVFPFLGAARREALHATGRLHAVYHTVGHFYLVPQILSPARSFYRDNAHLSSAILDVALPGYRKLAPKLSLGGSLLISSGSRPTSYYQPLGKLFLPVSKHVAWVSEWRYYGFGETFYSYEGFRTHLVSTGLRFTR